MDNGFSKFKLSKDIIRALDALQYKKPTNIQNKVINEILLNKDLIVKAQTGSGKTAAFVIPICEKIDWNQNDPQALILAPTRELAIQIAEDVKNIGRFKRINGIPVYGKSPFKEQKEELKGKVHVVIGTPGRVLDHIDRESFSTKNIKYLVIDEADEMLNMGFIRQIEAVIRRLKSRKRVTLLFSATMKEEIKKLAESVLYKPVEIEVKSEKLITDNIDHFLIRTTENEKIDYLQRYLIKKLPDTCVIFCRTKERVDVVYDFLKNESYSVCKIHGGMLQKERIQSMEDFKRGKFRILVATDIASRGIDVENITHVINYDIPLELESYVHRIGRTARIGKKGVAVTIVSQYEDKFTSNLEEYIGLKIQEIDKTTLMCSKSDVDNGKNVLKQKPDKKTLKEKSINKNITKIYLSAGKKKKIRTLDIVGCICNIQGVNSEDIGIIDIKDNCTYVDILNNKANIVLNALKEKKIKGKNVRVEMAKK